MIVRWLNMFVNIIDLDLEDSLYHAIKVIRSIEYEFNSDNFKFEKSAELIKGNKSKSLSYISKLNRLPPLIGILYKRNVLRKYYKSDVMSELSYSTGKKFPRKMNNVKHYEAFIKVDGIDDIIGIVFLSEENISKYLDTIPSSLMSDKRLLKIRELYKKIKDYCNENNLKIIEKDFAF